jgi:hypothetical protein
MKPRYAAFAALDPFFELVQRGLSDRGSSTTQAGTAEVKDVLVDLGLDEQAGVVH